MDTPLAHEDADSQDVASASQPWTPTHSLSLFTQTEVQTREDGAWVSRRPTGLVNLVCNCGLSTGWIPRDQMPDDTELQGHGVPLTADADPMMVP